MPGLVRKSGGNAGLFEPPHGIGVSMRADVLEHKQRDGKTWDGRYCFWKLTRALTDEAVVRGSKLWVASGGRWRGYFIIMDVVGPATEIRFHSETWHPHDGGPRSPFQGFTYKVPEAAA